MTKFSSLVGMFFLRDNGDTYLTGEIVSEVNDGMYLLKPDNMNNLQALPPFEIMAVEDMAEKNDYDIPAMSLFETRDALKAWVDWVEAPTIDTTGAKVINLVKK